MKPDTHKQLLKMIERLFRLSTKESVLPGRPGHLFSSFFRGANAANIARAQGLVCIL